MRTSSRRVVAVALIGVMCAVAVPVLAAGSSTQGKQQYLIMMPHTKEQCLKALDDMSASAKELLAKTQWGCMAGEHTGYVIVEATSEQLAREMVPMAERSKAKVIPLNMFTPEQIRSFHQK